MVDRPTVNPFAPTSGTLELVPLGAAAAAAPMPPPMVSLGTGGGLGSAAAGQPFDLGPMFTAPPPPVDKKPRQPRVSSGLGSAAAPPAPAPVAAPPPASALQSAIGEREGELSAIYDALGQPLQQVRTANPLRPIIENDAQTFYGGGQLPVEPFNPEPFDPSVFPRHEGETDEQYAARMALFEETDLRQQRETYDRGVAEQQATAGQLGNVRDIGKPGHLGMGEAQIQAAEGQSAAELEQAKATADAQRQAAEVSKQATEAAVKADQERRDFARQQRDAIAQAQAVQADAREKLAALPELDPNRTFKSMSAGNKFWAILGSLAGGAIGSSEVNDRLFAMAQHDLEAQKANAAQTFDAASTADRAVDQQMTLYRDLLGAAGDEAAADAMFLQLQLEDAHKMLEAQLAETTVPKLQADIQAAMVGLKQQIDQQQRAIDMSLATTPSSFLRTVDPLGPRTRKKLEERAAILEKERTDFQKMGVTGEENALERTARREEKALEGEAKVRAQVAGERTKEELEIKKATDEWGAVETLVSDFLKANPGDIAGEGLWLGGDQEARIKTRSFKRALKLLMTSGFTGASASEAQESDINGLIEGDWTELTDDAARTRLNEILNIASAKRRYHQKRLESLSTTPRISSGAELPSFVPEAD